jgi:hypothetical protein
MTAQEEQARSAGARLFDNIAFLDTLDQIRRWLAGPFGLS